MMLAGVLVALSHTHTNLSHFLSTPTTATTQQTVLELTSLPRVEEHALVDGRFVACKKSLAKEVHG